MDAPTTETWDMRDTAGFGWLAAARWIGAAALVSAAVGCGIVDSDGGEWQRELDSARTRWKAAQLTDYRYDVRQLCFCGFGGVLIEVEVRGGEVVGATAVESGEVIDIDQQPWAAPSVDDLFDRIQQIIENDPYEFSASYHPTMGYPLSVSADPVENTIDEEWGVEASGVEALPPTS
jgi:Family of unknown function (DUF6174)